MTGAAAADLLRADAETSTSQNRGSIPYDVRMAYWHQRVHVSDSGGNRSAGASRDENNILVRPSALVPRAS